VRAIERLVLDRLKPEAALQLVEHLLPGISAALIWLKAGIFRKGASRMTENAWQDEALEDALDALDRATLAWQVTDQVEASLERLGHLQRACEGFRVGQRLLEVATPAVKQADAWQVWQAEAARGLKQASRRLATLECE
jgi:hypothetical protein